MLQIKGKPFSHNVTENVTLDSVQVTVSKETRPVPETREIFRIIVRTSLFIKVKKQITCKS